MLLGAIGGLSASHMSRDGYHHETTPYVDAGAAEGVLLTENLGPHVSTTSGHRSVLTGLDCFSKPPS